MSISDRRNQIDQIDDKIAALYNERMRIIKAIAVEKEETGAPLWDGRREREILGRVTKEVDTDIRVLTKQVFGTLFDTSRAYQTRFVHLNSNIAEQIKRVLLNEGELKFPDSATVACQGVQGAYSSLAAERLFALPDITYVRDFEGVFTAVEKGLCEYGILPIENSTAGSVNAVYDLMKKHRFFIVKGIKLGVRHCLLAPKGAKLSELKEIYSHEQAISQCGEFIKTLKGVNVNVVENTAIAAEKVASSGSNDVAAIAGKQCAELYGLCVLENEIQDSENNYTRFICISKNLKICEGAEKISLIVNLPHEAGSLNKLLSKFTTLGLNLTKLESRPMKKSGFEFLFYFDFEANIKETEVLNLLAELDNSTEQFTFLGAYAEIQ